MPIRSRLDIRYYQFVYQLEINRVIRLTTQGFEEGCILARRIPTIHLRIGPVSPNSDILERFVKPAILQIPIFHGQLSIST